MVVGNSPSEEPRCADKNCNTPLPNKAAKYLSCPKCRKVTCVQCNAQHEGMNCEVYKNLLETEALMKKMTIVMDFKPGDVYCCGVNGCTFTVRLLEGSTKFWCPLCHSRHRIEGNKLVRTTTKPKLPFTQEFEKRHEEQTGLRV